MNRTDSKFRLILSLLLNCSVVGMEIAAFSLSWRMHGTGLFQFYTEDSNLFALAACAAYAVCEAAVLLGFRKEIPEWAAALKYTAACCLALTFTVVVCALAPVYGFGGFYAMLLTGSMLYQHLLCPAAVIVSYLFLERGPAFGTKYICVAMIPTVLYAGISVALNLTRTLHGPYPFLLVYEQPVWASALWVVVILGGAALLAWGILLANRSISRRNSPAI